jgi:alkylated DNA repair dioxygenase AlkB
MRYRTGMDLPPGLRMLPPLLRPDQASAHLATLLAETPWETHSFTIFGRTVPMPRRIQMYGPHGYRYSGLLHPPRPLTPLLHTLLAQVQEATGLAFNSVLLNLYRDQRDSMGWHQDDDYPHGGQPAVASLSLGATRRFRLRPRGGGEGLSLDLDSGSLLVLSGEALTGWQHAVPRTARPVGPRLNLTWRHMTGP